MNNLNFDEELKYIYSDKYILFYVCNNKAYFYRSKQATNTFVYVGDILNYNSCVCKIVNIRQTRISKVLALLSKDERLKQNINLKNGKNNND